MVVRALQTDTARAGEAVEDQLAAAAQQPYSKAVNEQIARVETNLSGGMVIDGKMYTLSESFSDKKGKRNTFSIGSIYILFN